MKPSLLALLVLFVAQTSYAYRGFECSDEKWIGDPTYENEIWSGTVSASCDLEFKAKPGSFETYLKILQDIQKQKIKIIEGPVEKTIGGVKEIRYEVIEDSGDPEEDKIEFTETVTLSTDFKSFIKMIVEPREIRAEGNSKLLKKLKNIYEIERVGDTDHYRATQTHHSEVGKPSFAPGFAFKPIAKDRVAKKVKKTAEKWSQESKKVMMIPAL